MVKKQNPKEEIFDKKKKSFFLKQLWNNYIKRLNKLTNGKQQCCK